METKNRQLDSFGDISAGQLEKDGRQANRICGKCLDIT